VPFLCALGRHSGYWSYADPADPHSCRQFRLCQRRTCNATEERVWHDHQIPPDGRVYYVSDEDCQAMGVCTRCGNIGGYKGIVHRWGDFQHQWNDDGELEAIQYCRHCPAYRVRPSVPVEFMNG
jgi:hypothetical protein